MGFGERAGGGSRHLGAGQGGPGPFAAAGRGRGPAHCRLHRPGASGNSGGGGFGDSLYTEGAEDAVFAARRLSFRKGTGAGGRLGLPLSAAPSPAPPRSRVSSSRPGSAPGAAARPERQPECLRVGVPPLRLALPPVSGRLDAPGGGSPHPRTF